MKIRLLKTKSDYNEALARLEVIFDAKLNTKEGDELELLSLLVEHYEKKHFPIKHPDPIDAIRFRMDQLNYTNEDLAKIVGFKGRVSEILNKKRKLSITMIRKIHKAMAIPTEILLQDY